MATLTRESESSRPGVPAWKRRLVILARNEDLSLLIFLGIVVAFFLVLEPSSRQSEVYFDLLRQISPYLICGVGMTLLLLAGQLDLTVGSMLAFTSVVTVDVFNRTGNMWLGIVAGLLTGPLIGVINGFLVTVLNMDSLMTTLGAMFTIRGLVYVYTGKTAVVDENGFTGFTRLWSSDLGPVPLPGLIALVPIALAYVLLTRTGFGRNIYAIGGNPQAARVSGINVERTKFILFVISSSLAALAGILYASQTGTGYFDAGVQGFELVVIASVVLGGISLAGGEGRVISAVIGVAILGMAGKGMRLMEVHITQQLVVTGILMLVAVYFHRMRKRFVASSRQWETQPAGRTEGV
jgi:ribose/xylose/arabinose/galactoside ABC-type transport system permease subunit